MNPLMMNIKCPYCYSFYFCTLGETNPSETIMCNECYNIFLINPASKDYEILLKYFLDI